MSTADTATEAFDAGRLRAIELDVDRRFVPAIRVHHAALRRWLGLADDAELREHGEALLLKMEHVMRVEQAESAPPYQLASAAVAA